MFLLLPRPPPTAPVPSGSACTPRPRAGQVAVTVAVSGTYPVIPLAAGLLWFRERLSAPQVSGICVAVAGLSLVSMSTRIV